LEPFDLITDQRFGQGKRREANFYTVYDLRRMKPERANLYLLCYAWQRFGQLTVAACHGRGTIPWAVSTPVQPSVDIPLLGGLACGFL
jgi:hypothetical protein